MASIETRTLKGGQRSYRVVWRQHGVKQSETFSTPRRAEQFRRSVELADNTWPEGWTKGWGYLSPPADAPGTAPADTAAPPAMPAAPAALTPVAPAPAAPAGTPLIELAARYIAQNTELGPGQRKTYTNQIRLLTELSLPRPDGTGTYRPFAGPIEDLQEADVRIWLTSWDRAPKTKANYHALLHAVLALAVALGLRTDNPCARTAPSRRSIRAAQEEHAYLTEGEFALLVAAAPDVLTADLLRVAVGTGLRWGELTALWVDDIDLDRRQIHVRKAWKATGVDGAVDTPSWLARQLEPHHTMRGHYLGAPKTLRSKRTIALPPSLVEVLERNLRGKTGTDFVFTTPARGAGSSDLRWAGGRPIHHADFFARRWSLTRESARSAGLTKRPRLHDLRHTHVAWLVAAGVPLPHIQQRLGHESITTTIDTYGHLMPQGHELIDASIDTALTGSRITLLRTPAA